VAEVAAHLMLQRPAYDVVQLFLPGLHIAAGLAAARLRGIASAVMFGSSSDVPHLRTLWLGRLQLAAVRRWADAVVVLNPEMRDHFISLGVQASRIAWLPCSVDVTVFRPPTSAERAARRKALALPGDAFVVTFVGRLTPAKNLPALVQGVGAFARESRRSILCIAGDGAERAHLEQLAARMPVGSVRFLGERSGDDVAHVLQASDIFAMVSHYEGIPCALIEAMAAGLPAIVHDIPALAQLVTDGEEGLRIPVNDALAMQRALRMLEGDAALRSRLGLAGRARAQAAYGVNLVAARHEELYLEAIARWRTGREARLG
jgi:glycosyltransferase involved in cell wall biosynthesis